MMLFEKMNAAMRHSAEEGKKRRGWTRRKTALVAYVAVIH